PGDGFHDDPARIEVERSQKVLDDGDEDLARPVPHHHHVVRSVGEHLRDGADRASVGQYDFASECLEVIELARAGRRQVLAPYHHGSPLERLGGVRVGDTFEMDFYRAVAGGDGIEEAKAAKLGADLNRERVEMGK